MRKTHALLSLVAALFVLAFGGSFAVAQSRTVELKIDPWTQFTGLDLATNQLAWVTKWNYGGGWSGAVRFKALYGWPVDEPVPLGLGSIVLGPALIRLQGFIGPSGYTGDTPYGTASLEVAQVNVRGVDSKGQPVAPLGSGARVAIEMGTNGRDWEETPEGVLGVFPKTPQQRFFRLKLARVATRYVVLKSWSAGMTPPLSLQAGQAARFLNLQWRGLVSSAGLVAEAGNSRINVQVGQTVHGPCSLFVGASMATTYPSSDPPLALAVLEVTTDQVFVVPGERALVLPANKAVVLLLESTTDMRTWNIVFPGDLRLSDPSLFFRFRLQSL